MDYIIGGGSKAQNETAGLIRNIIFVLHVVKATLGCMRSRETDRHTGGGGGGDIKENVQKVNEGGSNLFWTSGQTMILVWIQAKSLLQHLPLQVHQLSILLERSQSLSDLLHSTKCGFLLLPLPT